LIVEVLPDGLFAITDLYNFSSPFIRCTWPHESGHIWEAVSPHPSRHEVGLNLSPLKAYNTLDIERSDLIITPNFPICTT
ncbi:MAG: hypothetical protein V3U60_02335, partial [Gammaproteobacteria bacterium]